MAYNPAAARITTRMAKALAGKGVDPYNTGPNQMPTPPNPAEKAMKQSTKKGYDPYNSHATQSKKWAANADKQAGDPFEALKKHHDEYHKNTGKDPAKAIGNAAMFHKTLGAVGSMVPQPQDVADAQPTAGSPEPAAPDPGQTGSIQADTAAGSGYDPYNSPAGMAGAAPPIRR